ncbi:PAS domain-containing sensor histidine kinase [Leptospira haakeii]|uniref:histidine kinase n=1 Tax=Leptospira haakeii TaxID=2023198 RepID=A0ABX4PNM9_9LEPT|nr:ATP-binding protein [Leptospira haakeii]PKA17397.1 PAS domain-containing sensor histidine kinase [Leptospira haakeii]PKA21121.1 PAS domain-containing sensor histidine kinase [Leptospira haakeii]
MNLQRLKRSIYPPLSADPEKDVSIKLLYGLMYITFTVAVLYRIIHPLISEKPKNVYYSFYIIPTAVIICHLLAKSGRVKLGSNIMIFLQWLALCIVSMREGGVYATSFSQFMIIIVLASLILGQGGALFYALLSFFTGLLSIYLKSKGMIPAPSFPTGEWSAFIGNSVGFFMSWILMKFGLSGLFKIREELSRAQIHAKLGGITLNLETKEVTLTKEYRIMLGDKTAKGSVTILMDRFLEKYVEGDDKERIVSILAEGAKHFNDPSYSTEFIFKAKGDDGKTRYILAKGKYKDSIIGYGTGQDITEKHIAGEEIKASQELFSKVFKLSPYATSISNFEDGTYVDINDGFIELLGFTRDEAIGRTSVELGIWLSSTEREFFKEKIIKDGFLHNEEVTFRTKDGRYLQVEFSTRFTVIDGERRMINMVKDVSSKKEAEKLKILNNEISAQNELIEKQKTELESALAHLQKTQNQLILSEKMASLGQLVAGIAHEINNPIGVIRAANESVKSHFDRVLDRMQEAASVLENLGNEAKIEFQTLLKKGRAYQEIIPPKVVRAKTKILESRLKELGILESRNLAEGLIEAGLEAALEDFPKLFTGEKIQQVIQYALDEIQASRSSKLVDMSVDRTSKIVYALKNFSHFSNGGPKAPVDIRESIDTVLTIYQNQLKSGIEIIKEYEAGIPIVPGYSDDLLHVWTNLIYNAAQAMGFKGILKINVGNREKDKICIKISDTGPGIPESIQERIFEPFFTTKAPGEGSGLGLDIVKRIVENHGGTIGFETSSNGTAFLVILPQ